MNENEANFWSFPAGLMAPAGTHVETGVDIDRAAAGPLKQLATTNKKCKNENDYF